MTGFSENPEAPLAERMRPKTLEEVVGQEHLIGPGRPLYRAIQSGRIGSMIFWGPPGSGKTTLAKLIGEYTKLPFHAFSAVTAGVKELRRIIEYAKLSETRSGKSTILFVDEIHRFNKAQQDAFLPHVENGLLILIGATTQNPSFEVIAPLLSRARVVTLHPLGEDALKTLILRALSDKRRGFGQLDVEIRPDALKQLIDASQGDARVALNHLETTLFFITDDPGVGAAHIDLESVANALGRKALLYDKNGEEHYNLISAFHKSLRGSDAQAAIYWLYRMLGAGEDPLFIGRRMIRFAAEDVGLADPNALQIALAAFESWQKVGPPEAELALAQAATYLASAPKSNALYRAEKSVKAEIERTGHLPVPLHLRNAPTALMKSLGYARGYLYPHHHPGGVPQAYLPEKVRNRVFYTPTDMGFEGEIRKRIANRKRQ